MTRYCIAVLPSTFRRRYKFVKAIAYSQVDDGIEAFFTFNRDEALTVGTESRAWYFCHGLQVRYPFKNFAVIEAKVDQDE